MYCCYYKTNILYNITMNNVQISVAKGDISLHGLMLDIHLFRIKLNFCRNSSVSLPFTSQYSSWVVNIEDK